MAAQLPEPVPRLGHLSHIARPQIPIWQSFVQDYYSLHFLPTEDDLDRILRHNGVLGEITRNIRPSEMYQFSRRPRHIPRGLLDEDHFDNHQDRSLLEGFGEPAGTQIADFSVHHEDHSSYASNNSQQSPDPPSIDPATAMTETPTLLAVGHPSSEEVEPHATLPANPQPSHEPTTAAPAAPLPPYHTETFPPGRHLPGFVPLGTKRRASADQGNYWPIESELRGEIVHAELDNHKRRPELQRLTYREILEKYNEWNPVEGVKGGVVASTLRGYNRRYTIPDKKNRVRRPQWREQHLRALREAVPRATSRRGNISWKTVRESVEAATGRPFGLATLSAKWRELKGKGHGGGVSKDSSVAESDYDSEDEEGEDEEDNVEAPDNEPGLYHIKKRDGDEDEDDSSTGGATQAPGSTTQRFQVAMA